MKWVNNVELPQENIVSLQQELTPKDKLVKGLLKVQRVIQSQGKARHKFQISRMYKIILTKRLH